MRNIVILNSLHFSYPLPILMRVSYNTLIVKQNTSDYYKYIEIKSFGTRMSEPKTAADSQFRLSTDSPAKMLNDTFTDGQA